MFKPTFKERFFVFKEPEGLGFDDSAGMDLDLSGLQKAGEKQKEVVAKAEKVDPKKERLEAQDNYVDAQDAAATAYDKAWEKLNKSADPGAANDRMFALMNETGDSPYYKLYAIVGQSGAIEPTFKVADFKEVQKWPKDKLVAGIEALNGLKKRIDEGVDEIIRDMKRAESISIIGKASEKAAEEDSEKADKLIADL